MNDSVLAAFNLSKMYTEGDNTVSVLDQLSLWVQPAEMLAIMGVSGAGKSTLLHLLAGLDDASAGEVFWGKRSLAHMTEDERSRLRTRYLGFIYQFHHLLPEFNVLENVALPLQIQGLLRRESCEQAAAILEQVGLSARLSHRIGELSGGERQRVAIARAFVTHPQCILADEPTGNLDEKTAAAIFDLMLFLNQKYQTAFVVVTHQLGLANRMQRTQWLSYGKLEDRL